MNKQKKYNEIINQIQYKETPGPGFYGNKIHPTTIFNTNKTARNCKTDKQRKKKNNRGNIK